MKSIPDTNTGKRTCGQKLQTLRKKLTYSYGFIIYVTFLCDLETSVNHNQKKENQKQR